MNVKTWNKIENTKNGKLFSTGTKNENFFFFFNTDIFVLYDISYKRYNVVDFDDFFSKYIKNIN